MSHKESKDGPVENQLSRLATEKFNAGFSSGSKAPRNLATEDDIQTSVGTDVTNFFRVLFSFLQGIFNRDLTDFELYSSTYFPTSRKNDAPGTPDQLPQRFTEPKTELEKKTTEQVQKMHAVHADPGHPQRQMPVEEVAKDYIPDALKQALRQGDPRKILLDVIAKGESGGSYNIVSGGGEVALTDMTIGEVMAWQKENGKNMPSSAIGRYQLIKATLSELVEKYNIDPNEKFDAAMQDRLGGYLLDQRGFNDYISGQLPTEGFIKNLSMEWAALPKDDSGVSYYNGVGNNKARITPPELQAALEEAKIQITGREKSPVTEPTDFKPGASFPKNSGR